MYMYMNISRDVMQALCNSHSECFHAQIYVNIYIYICMYVCIHIITCIYMYIYL